MVAKAVSLNCLFEKVTALFYNPVLLAFPMTSIEILARSSENLLRSIYPPIPIWRHSASVIRCGLIVRRSS